MPRRPPMPPYATCAYNLAQSNEIEETPMTRPAPDRRRLLAPLVPAALASAASRAHAQDAWPTKPVTIVVPQAAGGANDTVARAFGQRLSVALGQPVVIENRTGAGGNVGTALVARAPKDGHTLMLTAQSAQTINPWLYKNTGFDPVKDFEPVMSVATAPYLLVANPQFPVSNLKDLVAYAKTRPGRIDYASAGNGTLNHLLGVMLNQRAGLHLVHIPYRGAAAAATDVVGGTVPITLSCPASTRTGRTTSSRRPARRRRSSTGSRPKATRCSRTRPSSSGSQARAPSPRRARRRSSRRCCATTSSCGRGS